MKVRPQYLLAALVLMLPLGLQPAHAQQANTLQERMSASDFYAAGLNKLSAQELASLNGWLTAHSQTTTKVVNASGEPVFTTKGKRETINTHITGHFEGWSGSNLVSLANGQQWQQVGSDHAQCNASDNAAVKIKPSLFGNWLMDVDGCNNMVHVRRKQ